MDEIRVLVIDDQYDMWEDDFRRGLERLKGYGVNLAGTISSDILKALDLIDSYKPDLIMLDVFFREGEMGKPILEAVKKKYPSQLPVMIVSQYMEDEKYVAKNYQLADAWFPKNLIRGDGIEECVKQINMAIADAKRQCSFDFIVGQTEYMKNVEKNIKKVAKTTETVLITGESGTGKSEVARAIHKLSNRKSKPFIELKCQNIPDTLIESELFGHEKGIFTGATYKKIGRIAYAEKGTLFLDEIGDITPTFQVKVLNFIDEKKYVTLGGKDEQIADVRIIVATNKDLDHLVSKEQYREDLYYRLNVFPIHLPPLRERKEDISKMVLYFIDKKNPKLMTPIKPVLRKDVKELLLAHHWPGNIRELENTIERAMVHATNDRILQTIHFPDLMKKEKTVYSIPLEDTKNVSMIVSRLCENKLTWKNVEETYAVKGGIRKKILEGIITQMTIENGQRPKSYNLARKLGVTTDVNMRRILKENDIQLTKMPREL